MGQKVNPISLRLGIIRGWDSNWYGGRDYSDKIVEDFKIRKYLMARLHKASVSKIIIERTLKLITITVNSSRPGIIIGKGGSEVDKLREELRMGAEGIKVQVAGRLGGAEMARTEFYKEGRIPLHTFRADIDYALTEAHTQYGRIGVKVWICKGEVYGKRDLSPNVGQNNKSVGGRKGGGRRDNRRKK